MRLSIRHLGMISSVGFGVVPSCAAIRAGITRPRELSAFPVLDAESQGQVPATGRPIQGYTEGFSHLGLWLRLARASVMDLLRQKGAPNASDTRYWRKTGLVAVMPSLDKGRFTSGSLDAMPRTFVQRLVASLKLPLHQESSEALPMGHAGVIAAVKQAPRRMATAGLDRLLVVAVDSYVDETALRWLANARRLKAGDNPCGLIPGEAGACFLLEADEQGVAVESAALGFEERHLFQKEPTIGLGLSKVLQEVLGTNAPEPFRGDVLSDLNGEDWRARELGYVRLRLRERLGDENRFVLPCESLGDVGAASGAVGVCVAVRSLLRGYSRTEQVLILSSSEHGHVGAMALRRTVAR